MVLRKPTLSSSLRHDQGIKKKRKKIFKLATRLSDIQIVSISTKSYLLILKMLLSNKIPPLFKENIKIILATEFNFSLKVPH